MTNRVPLSVAQRGILEEFYSTAQRRISLDKAQRNLIWADFKAARRVPDTGLGSTAPALVAELRKAMTSGNRVQSAVFSECVYAQALATALGLTVFQNYENSPAALSARALQLIHPHGLKPRYVYSSPDGNRLLVQAGGYGGVDSALISLRDSTVTTIEFKEPGAKTSEPDLPKYGEDGYLRKSTAFSGKYPQFESMIEEQLAKRLNFFERAGSNVNDFSAESISRAVSDNYAGSKFADVICVEDSAGYLAMLPANQVGLWADTRGEIRPAGRNKYPVWTPLALRRIIAQAGGTLTGTQVNIQRSRLTTAAARGGNGDVNRYKFHALFFVYATDVAIVGQTATFQLGKVLQLKPTISAHMFFKGLDAARVRRHYSTEF